MFRQTERGPRGSDVLPVNKAAVRESAGSCGAISGADDGRVQLLSAGQEPFVLRCFS